MSSFPQVAKWIPRLFLGLVGLGLFLLGLSFGRQTPVQNLIPSIPSITSIPSSSVEGAISVRITRVIDGDTVKLETGETVRLIGIDSPEVTRVECFGKEATAKLTELVLNQAVTLEKDVSETDRYGRLLRYIWLGDELINETLVREGYANSSPYPPDIKYQDRLDSAEREARQTNSGLWSTCSLTPSASDPSNPSIPPIPPGSSSDCLIKGNISSGGKIYHLPGCGSYDKTVIDESAGEKWFCSESEAISSGWRKAKNCN